MVNPWKAVLAALVIFLTGSISGVLAGHLYRTAKVYRAQAQAQARARAETSAPHGAAPRMQLMRRMAERLDLTPTQQERIDRHVRASQQRVRELYEPVSRKIQEEVRHLRKQIAAELDPPQRTQFDRLLKQRASAPTDDPARPRRREGSTESARPPEEPPLPLPPATALAPTLTPAPHLDSPPPPPPQSPSPLAPPTPASPPR